VTNIKADCDQHHLPPPDNRVVFEKAVPENAACLRSLTTNLMHRSYAIGAQRFLSPLLLLLAALSFRCNDCEISYAYQPPPDLNDGLTTATATEVGLDTARLAAAVAQLACGQFRAVHSLLLYKDGALVLEEYFPGFKYQWDAPQYRGEYIQWDRDSLHPIMSCTKSVASACIGIAVAQGHLAVGDPIFDYLPDHQEFRAGGKENITVEHLLTMTAGLDWNEWNAPHGTAANDVDRLYLECGDDPVRCVLERELVHPPGEYFTYNGGGIVILGEILKNATGTPIDSFAQQYLFDPLGIDTATWYRHPNGVVATDGTLYLRPRDMLKFGVTYLNGGEWQGQSILPAYWTERSQTDYGNNSGIKVPIEDSGRNGYGYTWWTSEFRLRGRTVHAYRANGWGGQVIMVFPELDMVMVVTGGNYAARSTLFKLVKKYILSAVE
jgi:CubicO group peptidase (beta-lactamase class C family)